MNDLVNCGSSVGTILSTFWGTKWKLTCTESSQVQDLMTIFLLRTTVNIFAGGFRGHANEVSFLAHDRKYARCFSRANICLIYINIGFSRHLIALERTVVFHQFILALSTSKCWKAWSVSLLISRWPLVCKSEVSCLIDLRNSSQSKISLFYSLTGLPWICKISFIAGLYLSPEKWF